MEKAKVATPEWEYPVISVPLAQAFPELGTVREFKSKVCIFSHDRSRLFDVVSPRYQVVNHSDALRDVQEACKEFFGLSQIKTNVRSILGGARIRADLQIPIPNQEVNKGDLVSISIQVLNSYDRSMPFVASLYGMRLVCTNGMATGSHFGSIRAKHVGKAIGESGGMLERLEDMMGNVSPLLEKWREWADVYMTYEEAVDLVGERFPRKYVDPFLQEDRFPMSKWDLYNHLTHFSTHQTPTLVRRLHFDNQIQKMFFGPDPAEQDIDGDYLEDLSEE